MSCEHSIILSLSLSLSIREWCQTYPISTSLRAAFDRAAAGNDTCAGRSAKCTSMPGNPAAPNSRRSKEPTGVCQGMPRHRLVATWNHPFLSFFILLKVQVQTSQEQRKQLSIGFTRHAFLFAMYHCEYWRPSQILHWYRFLPSSSKRSLTRTSCRKLFALWWKKSCIIRDWGVSVFACLCNSSTWNMKWIGFGNTSIEQKEKHIQDHTSRWAGKKTRHGDRGDGINHGSWDVCIPFLSIPSPRWPKSLPPLAHRHEQRAGKPQRSWNAWVSQLNPWNSLKLLKIWNPRFESWILRIPKSLSGSFEPQRS